MEMHQLSLNFHHKIFWSQQGNFNSHRPTPEAVPWDKGHLRRSS